MKFFDFVKKLFIRYSIFIFVLPILLISFCAYSYVFSLYDDKDACLDSGVCKEGLVIKINGQEIKINKNTCLEYNGKWREKYNDCILKN